jgi:glycosyltransferase involved in cell wall biosynthesis
MRPSILYLSYDGMLEPLGQSQVLRYLEGLAGTHAIHLVSFEKPEDWRRPGEAAAMGARLRTAGIRWHPLRYHRTPSALATAWDIARGTLLAVWLAWRHRVQVVHARSYVAAVMALAVRRLTRARFLFDMRGFWADERVDGGLWPAGGRLYRAAKRFERTFLLRADCIVSLTHAGVRAMQGFPYLRGVPRRFEVIPTCADLDRFRLADPGASAVAGHRPFTVGYVGSVGLWYLFDETVRCLALLREQRPEARLLVLNRGEHAFIRHRLAAGGIPPDSVELRAADQAEVAQAMREMDATVFFITPAFSKTASAPTRLGEFLWCGVPCLGNAGVGDMAAILRDERVGVALERFDDASLRQGIDQLLALAADPGIRARCRRAAERHFALEEGVRRYAAIYRSLVEAGS